MLLAILYGAFALLLSRETFHRFNRLALLGVMIASLVLPAIHVTMQKPGFLIMEQGAWRKEQENTTEMLTLEQSYIQIAQSNIPEPREIVARNAEIIPNNPLAPCSLPLAPILYICGLLASLSIFFLQLFRLWRETKGGVRTKDELGNTIIIHGGDFAPYSFLHYIFISASDYEHLRRPILTHEQAHIRLGHTYDLLLFEVVKAVQWFNPFVYLLGRDLKAVHEYEADNAVLNFGIDAKTYQLLLVTKAVGSRLQTVCNNLSHHSLK